MNSPVLQVDPELLLHAGPQHVHVGRRMVSGIDLQRDSAFQAEALGGEAQEEPVLVAGRRTLDAKRLHQYADKSVEYVLRLQCPLSHRVVPVGPGVESPCGSCPGFALAVALVVHGMSLPHGLAMPTGQQLAKRPSGVAASARL